MKITAKHCLIIFLLFFLYSNSTAQYKSVFGKKQTSWNYLTFSGCGYNTAVLTYKGDSIIESKKYKVFNMYNLEANGDTLCGSRLFLFAREDTLQGKLWTKIPDETSEFLIYDLSLVVGDSIEIPCAPFPGYIYVDSTYIESGKKHIRFNNINEHCNSPVKNKVKMEYIEGIGNTYYMVPNYITAGASEFLLLCKNQDSLQVYKTKETPYDTSCNTYISGPFGGVPLGKLTIYSLNTYPNPAADELFISSEEAGLQHLQFELRDITGKLILNKNITINFKETVRIPLTAIPTGIYGVRAFNSKGEIKFQGKATVLR